MAASWDSWGSLGVSWRPLGLLLAASWGSWRAPWVSWRPLGPLLAASRALGELRGSLGSLLAASWGSLGTSWLAWKWKSGPGSSGSTILKLPRGPPGRESRPGSSESSILRAPRNPRGSLRKTKCSNPGGPAPPGSGGRPSRCCGGGFVMHVSSRAPVAAPRCGVSLHRTRRTSSLLGQLGSGAFLFRPRRPQLARAGRYFNTQGSVTKSSRCSCHI